MESEDIDKLYSLKFHEGFTSLFGVFILRVPGGWIYDCWDRENDQFKFGIFIPFNNEFMK